MRSLVIVFVGSGAGGVLRYVVGVISLRLFGPAFPVGTLAINIVGSGLMGLLVAVLDARSGSSIELRLMLTTGLIGGFTTWSTFSLDAVSLWERGQPGAATAYVLASLILSFAVLAGILTGARHLS